MRIGFGLEAVGGVDARVFVQGHFCATGGPFSSTAPTERAEAKRFAGFFELETDVFFLDEANRRGEGEAASDKDWFAISDAEGFAAGEPVEEVWA